MTGDAEIEPRPAHRRVEAERPAKGAGCPGPPERCQDIAEIEDQQRMAGSEHDGAPDRRQRRHLVTPHQPEIGMPRHEVRHPRR